MNSVEKNPDTLKKQVSTYRVFALVLPLIIMFTAIVATMLADKQITLLVRGKQEVVANNQSQAETVQFNNFISLQQSELERIDYALPSESMIVGVVQDIEGAIHSFDKAGSLQFASATPVRSGTDLTIPLTIKAKLPLNDIPVFMETIKSLPYLIQFLTIDSQVTNKTAECTFGLRLYVQEPFTGI